MAADPLEGFGLALGELLSAEAWLDKAATRLDALGLPRSAAEVREARRGLKPAQDKVRAAIRELSVHGDRRAGGRS